MSNKLIFALVGILFIVMIGLTGGLFMIWTKLNSAEAQAQDALIDDRNGKLVQSSPGTIFPLDTFIVNLADEGGKRYLRITMDLELTRGISEAEVEKRLSQMRDSILMVLPSKRFEEIRTLAGKTNLRNEIIASLNGLFGQESISNIYFTEFVVQ
ncbi:MAG: flagellar basal body-associated FliL family protein [Deltaproteobacteria bacterium]|jgi:flagellar FliL protein|nr:flagellar basal body-associated FliL family protein [Deltaproteobacteria bacterium]